MTPLMPRRDRFLQQEQAQDPNQPETTAMPHDQMSVDTERRRHQRTKLDQPGPLVPLLTTLKRYASHVLFLTAEDPGIACF